MKDETTKGEELVKKQLREKTLEKKELEFELQKYQNKRHKLMEWFMNDTVDEKEYEKLEKVKNIAEYILLLKKRGHSLWFTINYIWKYLYGRELLGSIHKTNAITAVITLTTLNLIMFTLNA